MKNGWIKIHRDILEHWICADSKKFHQWIILLLRANHAPQKMALGRSVLTIKRGQSALSLRGWASVFNIGIKAVVSFFQLLESDNMIVRETVGKGKQSTTLITIVNYDDYQGIEETQGQRKGNAEETQGQREGHTNKNIKNIKNVKNIKNNDTNVSLSSSKETRPTSPSFSKKYSEFIIFFNSEFNREFRGDKKSNRQFNARIKEGYTWDDWKKAIVNLKDSDFHKNNGYTYITPEFLTRATKLEQWLNAKKERIVKLDFNDPALKILTDEFSPKSDSSSSSLPGKELPVETLKTPVDFSVFAENINELSKKVSVLFPPEITQNLTNVQKWAWVETLDKLNRIEKLTDDEIYEIVRFARQDDFWKKNFLSVLMLQKDDKMGVKYWVRFNEERKNKNRNPRENDPSFLRMDPHHVYSREF